MNLFFRVAGGPSLILSFLLLMVSSFASIGAEEIRSYRVPKEVPQATLPPGHSATDGHNHAPQATTPKISYTTPEAWRDIGAGDMRTAGFMITGTNGQTAQVAITPLPGMAGRESLIVNMWRQQIGLSELSPEETMKELTVVEVGGVPGKMFDMAGKSGAGATIRIVTAMMHRGEQSWFFKLQGDDELVTAQKQNFVTFLKSVKIEESAAAGLPGGHPPIGAPALPDGHPPMAGGNPAAKPAAPVVVREGGPNWTVPVGWKEVTAGAMQVAKFSVPEVSGAKADVMISVFPNSTGGTLANINRWRNQIGLAPAGESDLGQIVKPLDAKMPDALVADLINGKRRLVGAIVPRGGQWYFFKLMGDDAAIAPQKEAFTKFVKESKY